MAAKGVAAVSVLDEEFPQALKASGLPPIPILFYIGDLGMTSQPSVGMCGSRSVSDLGLRAAGSCGAEASDRKMAVVSGYARGVDTETHLAALRTGGKTVIVLAEGIDHFRIKKPFASDYAADRALVLSQFNPTQPWQAHAAMTRNATIFGLSDALVVIEAGERGGTLAAGKGALRAGKPVFVLNFGVDTPKGNQVLLDSGGRPIASRTELGKALDQLAARTRRPAFQQGELGLG